MPRMPLFDKNYNRRLWCLDRERARHFLQLQFQWARHVGAPVRVAVGAPVGPRANARSSQALRLALPPCRKFYDCVSHVSRLQAAYPKVLNLGRTNHRPPSPSLATPTLGHNHLHNALDHKGTALVTEMAVIQPSSWFLREFSIVVLNVARNGFYSGCACNAFWLLQPPVSSNLATNS